METIGYALITLRYTSNVYSGLISILAQDYKRLGAVEISKSLRNYFITILQQTVTEETIEELEIGKSDRPGLFSDGKVIAVNRFELERRVIEPFEDQTWRKKLVSSLYLFLDSVRTYGAEGHAVIGGSLVTTEANPDDADIVLIINIKSIQTMDDKILGQLKTYLQDRIAIKERYNCDVYFVSSADDESIAIWVNSLKKGNSGVENRGLAKVEI